MNNLILIIEDEASIRSMLRLALELAEFKVLEATQVQEAKTLIAENMPDLILLDWMLPGISGIEFAKQLKHNALTKNIPIILLTAKAEEENKIKGLDVGADDYITKPFSPRELIARIKTVLRRGPLVDPRGILTVDNICIDINAQQVTIADKPVALSALEYRLLHFLMKNPNRVLSREYLLAHVWNDSTDINDRTVDVQMRRLRKLLEPFNQAFRIETVRGGGYKFSDKTL